MGTNQEVLLQDDLDIEKGFNDAIDDLRKSLGHSGGEEGLRKAKKGKKNDDDSESMAEEAIEEEVEEEVDDDEDEEEESYRKSIEDTLREEPEAAAAMDVEPFLLQLAKAIDESIGAMGSRVGKVEKLVKSIGNATVASADLQKSMNSQIEKIGGTPVPTGSVRRLQKARFEGSEQDFDTRDVLAKSRDWVKTNKIDLTEAGSIEGRINKGLLGKVNDKLDQKVAALMREE